MNYYLRIEVIWNYVLNLQSINITAVLSSPLINTGVKLKIFLIYWEIQNCSPNQLVSFAPLLNTIKTKSVKSY